MLYSSTLTKSGQATIPKVIRDILGIGPEDHQVIFETMPDGTVTISKEMTSEEARAYMDSFFNDKESQKLIKKYAGMSVSEMRKEWESSPEGQAYLKEEYGL